MIKLYGNRLSTYCAKVRVVLRHKGVPFEDCSPPDGYGSEAYRRIVPMGTIPGLVDGAIVLSESEAIAEYLEERYPEPAMLFGDAAARARIRTLSRIHDCWVEPQLRALYAHADPARRDDAAARRHVEQFHRRLSEFAHSVAPAPLLAGSSISLADCAWATTLLQAELMMKALAAELRLPASLRAWRVKLEEHRAVAPGVGPCRDAMVAWLARVSGAA